MRILKNYRFTPSNISQGLYAKMAMIRMGKSVQLLSVSAHPPKSETKVNEEFTVSVIEEEKCDIVEQEVFKFFLVPVWKNDEKFQYQMLAEDYTFLNCIQLENEAYNVFWQRAN